MGFWWFFNATLLVAGVFSVAMSVVWRSPNLLLNMIVSRMDLNFGAALGGFFLVTWAVSIGAVIQRNHVNIGLVILNWTLLIDMAFVLFVGSSIWYFTLHELANFHQVYSEQTPEARTLVQDMFKCCGYFNSTDLVEIGGTFCTDSTFVSQTNSFCWLPITNKADVTLNLVFTSIYGFMAILGCLFLTSLCVINERNLEERFKKIDSKRGGRGFV